MFFNISRNVNINFGIPSGVFSEFNSQYCPNVLSLDHSYFFYAWVLAVRYVSEFYGLKIPDINFQLLFKFCIGLYSSIYFTSCRLKMKLNFSVFMVEHLNWLRTRLRTKETPNMDSFHVVIRSRISRSETVYRTSCLEILYKKGVFRNLAIFTGQQLCCTPAQVFTCLFC